MSARRSLLHRCCVLFPSFRFVRFLRKVVCVCVYVWTFWISNSLSPSVERKPNWFFSLWILTHSNASNTSKSIVCMRIFHSLLGMIMCRVRACVYDERKYQQSSVRVFFFFLSFASNLILNIYLRITFTPTQEKKTGNQRTNSKLPFGSVLPTPSSMRLE